MIEIACLLLAAGNSSRFGGKKQLAIIDGQPMIVHTLNQLKRLFREDVCIVTGAYADDISPYIADEAHVIVHDGWASGMGSSIVEGVRAICDQKSYAGIMVAVVDQVELCSNDYQRLLDRFDGNNIVASEYNAVVGVPAIFPQRYYEQLLELEGEHGARKIIRQYLHQVTTVVMPNAVMDIDTKQDLMRFKEVKHKSAREELF